MKAERRHELRTNTLAQFLADLPLYIRFHANKFLIGIIVICLAVLLIRYRMNQAEQARQAIRTSLTDARNGIDRLKMLDRSPMSDVAKAQERRNITGQVNSALNTIFENFSQSDDPAIRAEALVARGDLNWTLAHLGPIPGAATQPGLAQPSPVELLQTSEEAYQRILKEYPAQNIAKAAALFGLAGIEEDRLNWDKATAHYNAIIGDNGIAQIFQTIARQRILIIPEIKTTAFLGSFSATQPASQPSTQEAAAPASLPATNPQ